MLRKRVGNNTSHAAQAQRTNDNEPARRARAHGQQRPTKQPNYEQLGRLLFAIGETGTKNRKKLYRVAFWKGVWGGLGGVVGATIVVSILLFIFNVLGSVPLVGEFIDIVEKSVPSKNPE